MYAGAAILLAETTILSQANMEFSLVRNRWCMNKLKIKILEPLTTDLTCEMRFSNLESNLVEREVAKNYEFAHNFL